MTDGTRDLRRSVLAGGLAVALLVVLPLTTVAWAAPSGATERPAPRSAVTPPTSEANGSPTSVTTEVTPSTPPPLVEQSPLPGDTTPTDPVDKGGSLNNILPRPNSGHEPTYQGDRGTGSQYAVLGGMLLMLGAILALVTRQSRRSKARWSAAAPMAGTSEVGATPPSDDPASEAPGSDAP